MGDTVTSKAQEICKSLTIKQTSITDANKEDRGVASPTSGLLMTFPITEDQRLVLGTGSTEGRQAVKLEQSLEMDQLLGVTDRVCKRCRLVRVELPITHGTIFFSVIASYALSLRMLHRMQLRKSEERIQQLGKSLGKVTTPSGLSGSKSHLDSWRTIIKLILDANIINTKGAIAFETVDKFDIVQRLISVQSQVVKRGLVSFKSII
ncbi:MAG: hypothetical protein M1830_008189 [Pleopsidium flavum]|nr:MAG: hypothetical protein M1830_008189 [Pleopsidium flavum]